MHGAGFEPTKHYVMGLKPTAFDRLAIHALLLGKQKGEKEMETPPYIFEPFFVIICKPSQTLSAVKLIVILLRQF